jgi:glycosyltransferase involved in cell wall biosynthesis
MPDDPATRGPGADATPSVRTTATTGKISVLLPAYNEAENLGPVIDEIAEVITGLGHPFEIIVIDDGSTDATPSVVAALSERHPYLVGLRMRRNVGKSAALAAGFTEVTGRTVVLMDADGQDDPHELGRLLDAIDDGLDLVTGRRSIRQDRFVKRHTSRLFNKTTAWVSGVDGRDFNCGFKAMRREVADSLHLYGELHRYIPVLAHWDGFRVGEVDVEHRTRLHGDSKFGSSRFWRGCLDLVTVRFLTSYANRPLHLFGSVGIGISFVGMLMLAWLFVEQQFFDRGIGQRPALIVAVLLVIIGIQFLSLGLIAQLLVHLSKPKDPRSWLESATSRIELTVPADLDPEPVRSVGPGSGRATARPDPAPRPAPPRR